MAVENEDRPRATLWPQPDELVPLASLARAADGDSADAPVAAAEPARMGDTSAADFAAERMLRLPVQRQAAGWRLALFRASGGLVRLGPSAAELRQQELIARVKTPIAGCRKVAFLSRKGGVGKTTTCLLVGHTFASYRGDRVVALDANPDAGTLAQRLRRESAETIATLLDDGEQVGRYADVRAYSSQAGSRLEVIAGDERSEVATALSAADVGRAVSLLERHYNLVCLDTAAGVLGSAAQGVLHAADQVVIVSPPSLDGARAAAATLDWLCEHGYTELARGAVAVLNGVRDARSPLDLDQIEAHFAARCRACIRIPWDPHLDPGAEVSPDQLRAHTRQAYLQLAAAIAGGFTDPPSHRR